jgi:hypothetical protein
MVGHVGDDNATRQRRYRAHKRGDHSLCRYCEAFDDERATPVAEPPAAVAAALREFRPVLADCAACLVVLTACESAIRCGDPLPAPVLNGLRTAMLQMTTCEHAGMTLDKLKATRTAGRLLALVDRLGG